MKIHKSSDKVGAEEKSKKGSSKNTANRDTFLQIPDNDDEWFKPKAIKSE